MNRMFRDLSVARRLSQNQDDSCDSALWQAFSRLRQRHGRRPALPPRLRSAVANTRDALSFLRAAIADPQRVGAIAPSGRALADAITAEISPASAPVIEIGPGTGSFTQRLLERGVAESRLALIEYGPEFATMLRDRFPAAMVLRMDAAHLRHAELFDGEKAGAVVSGLPLLAMSPRKVIAILKGAFAHLRADGALYQFTYGPTCPVPRAILRRLGLQAVRIGGALANIPPASVYRITRAA